MVDAELIDLAVNRPFDVSNFLLPIFGQLAAQQGKSSGQYQSSGRGHSNTCNVVLPGSKLWDLKDTRDVKHSGNSSIFIPSFCLPSKSVWWGQFH
jgi:hypothetical protein